MTISSTLPQDLLGAHTSAAGGPHNALEEGVAIGATMIQLFTANQRQWHHAPLTTQTIERFHATRAESSIAKVMSHASYLINLGSPKEEARQKSQKAFIKEIQRCQALGVDYLNFHPGAALDGTKEACLDRIVDSLLSMEPFLQEGNLRLLVESTAGQGSLVGATFEELAHIINGCKGKIPLGVCLDTCHAFAAGYPLQTPQEWEATLAQFDTLIGRKYLEAFHLNDSMRERGSHIDRHAPLGEGAIGLPSFAYLVQCPTTQHLPMCLETPGGPTLWQKEIQTLRQLRSQSSLP